MDLFNGISLGVERERKTIAKLWELVTRLFEEMAGRATTLLGSPVFRGRKGLERKIRKNGGEARFVLLFRKVVGSSSFVGM